MIYIFLIVFLLFVFLIFLISPKRINKVNNLYFHNSKYSRSAFNQDILIHHFCFKQIKLHDGYFLEIGAHDGYTSSNTYYFEKNFNWKGLLIEGDPNNCEKLKKYKYLRKNSVIICSPICMYDYVSIEVNNYRSKVIKSNSSINSYKCKKLADIVTQLKIAYIDLFSLDVEGSEIEVLESFNFSVPVKCFLIERNGNIKNLEKILLNKGYKKNDIFRSPSDNLYYID